ncbi:uncharacterized protein Tco025E_07974 [Trypanosoma conorhini]|uniref:Uncharacterized protein n=1 Tax=Trypanosoma conorhini TaxID=83891 RepID=A0A422NFZ5_9TRYP|nr:uncharacterized protein Tco025E_07974 [Trypanosoma conorhini]RNF04367.1 hypothetical protein Tco025E_07974 [Trypanosoma conorhini]
MLEEVVDGVSWFARVTTVEPCDGRGSSSGYRWPSLLLPQPDVSNNFIPASLTSGVGEGGKLWSLRRTQKNGSPSAAFPSLPILDLLATKYEQRRFSLIRQKRAPCYTEAKRNACGKEAPRIEQRLAKTLKSEVEEVAMAVVVGPRPSSSCSA